MADFTYHPTAFSESVFAKPALWVAVVIVVIIVWWWSSSSSEHMDYEGTVGPLKEKAAWGISSTLLGDRTGYPGLYTTGKGWNGH